MGPSGFNGSQGLQGPQGPQGVGNMSACNVNQRIGRGAIAKGQENQGQAKVSYVQRKVSMSNSVCPFYKLIHRP
jgi:hypothetical protein